MGILRIQYAALRWPDGAYQAALQLSRIRYMATYGPIWAYVEFRFKVLKLSYRLADEISKRALVKMVQWRRL